MPVRTPGSQLAGVDKPIKCNSTILCAVDTCAHELCGQFPFHACITMMCMHDGWAIALCHGWERVLCHGKPVSHGSSVSHAQ